MLFAAALAVLVWEFICSEASELYDYEYSDGYSADNYRNYGEGRSFSPGSDAGRVRRFGAPVGRPNRTLTRENDLNRAFRQIQSGRQIDASIPMQITGTEPNQDATGLISYELEATGSTTGFKTYLVTADGSIPAPNRTGMPMTPKVMALTSQAMALTSMGQPEISRTHFLRPPKIIEPPRKSEFVPYGLQDFLRGQPHDQASDFHQASVISSQGAALRTDETTTTAAAGEEAEPTGAMLETATTTTATTTASATTTTTTTTKPSTQFDIEKFLEIVANLTYDYETNLTQQVNETLYRMSIPTCPTPTTEPSTTTDMEYHVLNRTIISKCFVCGLEAPGIPFDADCADAFAGDFLPLVPQDPRAKGKIARYRKYCRYGEFHNYFQNASQPRTLYGRWTGGCSVRWTDLSGIYTQRSCRNRRRAVTGLHYASKRMAKLEMALANTDSGCIVAPVATLLPLSRGISLFARFHACVCVGNWCNTAVRDTASVVWAAVAVGTVCLAVLLGP